MNFIHTYKTYLKGFILRKIQRNAPPVDLIFLRKKLSAELQKEDKVYNR